MAQITTRGLENNSVTGAKLRLNNAESLRARNAANTADISLFNLNNSNEWTFQVLPKYSGSNLATESFVTASYIPLSQKGVSNGVATLDGSGKVPSDQLPSFVDDVLEYADLAAFPATGSSGIIYVAIDTKKVYRWSGSAYVEISPSEVNSVNGLTGVVTLTTSNVAEGTNLYYTTARFDTALATKSTSNLSEGTNLYFTDARAKTAAVVNSMVGTQTDQAPSVSAVKSYIASQSANVEVETFTLTAGNITNGYIDLANLADKVIEVTPKGFPVQHPVDDYVLSTVSSVTRLTFAGDMLTLVAGDKLKVAYSV
jgi:hypothetical protein